MIVSRKQMVGLLIVLASLAVWPATLDSAANPVLDDPVMGPNGHLYQPIDIPMSWHEARNYCASLGAHLVTISSTEENTFVYDLLPWTWLGATDEAQEGTWQWVTDEPWSYENWAPYEPNNCCPPENCGGSGCTPEHYLTFRFDLYPYQWNDAPNGIRYFICEWDIRHVVIDIKPGNYPNSINLWSAGVVPVAILTTDDFDAATVDPATVLFAGASPLRWVMEDVDYDGDMDLLLHFKTRELNLSASSVEAMLTGFTFTGLGVQGTDTVNIVP